MFIFWKPCYMTGCPYLLVPIEKCVTKMYPWHPSHVWGAMAGWPAFETTSFSSSTSTSVGSVVLGLCKIKIWDTVGLILVKVLAFLIWNFWKTWTISHPFCHRCLDRRTLIVSNADAWYQYGIKPCVWVSNVTMSHIWVLWQYTISIHILFRVILPSCRPVLTASTQGASCPFVLFWIVLAQVQGR